MDHYAARRLKDRVFTILGGLCVVLAVIPLGSILLGVIAKGLPAMSWAFLTTDSLPSTTSPGGIGPAIQGTLMLVGLTSLIGIPIGIMSGIFLAEYGTNRYASVLRLLNDVLTEFPSIVAGITIYLTFVLIFGYSTIAGALALCFILIPIVSRTTEESVKLVPNSLREASLALGIRKWRGTVSVVLRAARSGLITGSLLAVARVAGETAPLIFTAFGNSYFATGLNGPVGSLTMYIFSDWKQPYQGYQLQAWGAALVLILMVLLINIAVRLATRGRGARR
ncbi:MAG: phosphate ABC transporter permease PstA [archaeon]|nr:MAG: phosphate ABC transporter permease PstA [archaeon]